MGNPRHLVRGGFLSGACAPRPADRPAEAVSEAFCTVAELAEPAPVKPGALSGRLKRAPVSAPGGDPGPRPHPACRLGISSGPKP